MHPQLVILLHGLRNVLFIVMMSQFFFSCKSKTSTIPGGQSQQISLQVPNNHFPPKKPMLRVVINPDSLVFSKKGADEPDFFCWVESEKKQLILDKELIDLIHYPDEYRDEDIEGRWYYDVYFDHQCITSWTQRKGPKGTILMEKEIEKAFTKLQPGLRCFFEKKCIVHFEFNVVLERVY